MKPILLNFDREGTIPLYLQLYNHIKKMILQGEALEEDRLPSLRALAKNLNISITTAEQAYNQLLVEGYVISRPQSGYYVARVASLKGTDQSQKASSSTFVTAPLTELKDYTLGGSPYLRDLSCFDFNKWKKCSAKVFNEFSHLLLFESEPQGEAALRFEVSKYLYRSRGVSASPDQIVIGAGTQQITSHLSRILLKMGMKHVSMETPGYLPVQSMFADAGFAISHIPVGRMEGSEGIEIERLPVNIPSAVYVSPSNQFPTGAVMPAGRRYQLLEWAKANQSIIIEDDYDSELRYFGKPVPALQSLDEDGRVVYLGSFSSTLFPAVKISYMVLPEALATIFHAIKDQYTQTCSKAEQLTLAFFMEDGYYYTGIKKLRNLYAQKLQTALQAFARHGNGLVTTIDTQSGINLSIRVNSHKTAEKLSEEAKQLQLQVIPLSHMSEAVPGKKTSHLIFYYNQVPLKMLEDKIEKLLEIWKEESSSSCNT